MLVCLFQNLIIWEKTLRDEMMSFLYLNSLYSFHRDKLLFVNSFEVPDIHTFNSHNEVGTPTMYLVNAKVGF